MQRIWSITWLCMIGALCVSPLNGQQQSQRRLDVKPDAPVVSQPKSGKLTGILAHAGRIKSLKAVSRVSGKVYLPATFNRKSGEFAFEDMPGDAVYDLQLVLTDGREIEGIDLEFVDARLDRLAEIRRRELGIKGDPRQDREFTAEDVRQLKDFVDKWPDFLGQKRVLYIKGYGYRATMLVELMRLREFHGSKDDLVWRVELWYFENQYGGWERLANQERMLRRIRTSPEKWAETHVEYYPQLNVYVRPDGRSTPLRWSVPAKANPRRGRLAGMQPLLPSDPFVMGIGSHWKDTFDRLDVPAGPSPDSKPAEQDKDSVRSELNKPGCRQD